MEFFHGIVALLAGIVLVLTGLVAWLYIQQSRMSEAINALAVAVTAPPLSFGTLSEEEETEVEPEAEPEVEVEAETEAHLEPVVDLEVDDRVSVRDDDVEEVAPQVMDAVDVAGKTVAELRQLLTEKGIPFNKSDKKSTLISLVQIAS
jgi:hypothetical protein